jgi:hypothetical protein
MGAVLRKGHEPLLVLEFMEHGSLRALLNNETVDLTSEIVPPSPSQFPRLLRHCSLTLLPPLFSSWREPALLCPRQNARYALCLS